MRHHRHTRTRSSGFTLIEVMIAMTVVTIASTGLLGAIGTGANLQQQNHAYSEAQRATRQVHESLRSGDLATHVAEFRQNPEFKSGDIRIEVRFPAQPLVDVLGRPIPDDWRYRDADNDGNVELNAASTARALLLPVEVTARWSGGEMKTSFLILE